MYRFLFSVALCLQRLTPTTCTGCQCDLRHPQKAFCDENSFFLKVNVTSSYIYGTNETMHGQIIEDYKGTYPIGDIDLTSFIDGTNCEVSLALTCWIISGKILTVDPPHGVITACDFRQLCSAITDFQQDAFNRAYIEGCKGKCEIYKDGDQPSEFRGCVFNQNDLDLNCVQLFGECRPMSSTCRRSPCMWKIETTDNRNPKCIPQNRK